MADTYYAYKDVKVKIAHRLFKMDGWKVYGYKGDHSDSMTDYYDPANWGGIAEKNGYRLVIGHKSAAEDYTQERTIYSPNNNEYTEKIKKLQQMTQERGASEAEEATARAMIAKLQNKRTSEETTETIYYPGHMANPPRCNWHIEKDGVIYDKGTGLLKFASVPDISGYGYGWEVKEWQKFNTMTPEEWKADYKTNYEYKYGAIDDTRVDSVHEECIKEYALLDKFNELLARFNNICGGSVGNTESGYYTYEQVKVTKYKKELKPVVTATGSIKDGQCFILKSDFSYGCNRGYVYRIHEHYTSTDGTIRYTSYRLGKGYKKERTGTATQSNTFSLWNEEKFLKWIEKGAIAWCDLEEVETPYEVTKTVKKHITPETSEEPTADATQNTQSAQETDEPTATEESTTETTETATEPTKSAPAEEVPQTDETTTEEPETATERTTSTAPDMFAELAKAYATGRTAKSARKATDTAKADKATDTAPEEEKANIDAESAPKYTQPEFTTGKTLGKLHAEIERNGKKYIVDAADMGAHGDTIDGRYDVMIMTKGGNEVDSTRTNDPAEARKAFWLYCERYTAAEIEKSETGYTPEAHPVITAEDVQQIDNGEQVRHTIDRNIIVAYFATPYNDRTKLLYNINSGYQEDNVHPGTSASYTGFITDGVLYTDESAMRSALDADIETYIRRMIPDEISAKKRINFDNLEEYKKREVESAIQYSRTKEARRLFYDNKEDDLILYRSARNTYSTATLIRYAENPGEVVKEYAEEYIKNNIYKIYAEYIRHNNTSAILEAIKATPEDEAHLLKKISESIGEDQKTVRIELATGKIVKCDASAVRNIKIMETISDWHIANADRNKLEKSESGYGRKDIKPEDIKKITHGQRVLYAA